MEQFVDAPAFLTEYLNYMEVIKGRSKKTCKEYYFDLRTFFRFLKLKNKLVSSDAEFGTIDISDVTLEMIDKVQLTDLYEFLAFMNRNRHNSFSTRARKVSCLRSFYRYLNTKAGVISHDPAKQLDVPSSKKSLPKYLTLNESQKLLDAIDGTFQKRDFAIITLFLNCGLRLSELVQINMKDIRGNTLYVTGKGNKERTIYLNNACMAAIEEYLKVRPHEGVKDRDALFLSRQNNRISNIRVQQLVKEHMETAGIDTKKYSVHKLRHTAATLLYKYGNVDIRLLQEILGHENLNTTEIYTHIDNEQLRKAVDSNPLADYQKKEEEL